MFKLKLPLVVCAAAIVCLAGVRVSAQQNPSEAESQRYRNNPCTDPWVSKAVLEVKGEVAGRGDSDACAIKLYNNGSWSSYAQLVGYVRQRFGQLNGENVDIRIVGGQPALVVLDLNRLVGGARVVAQGGGNVVGPGGASVIVVSGGNVIAQGGGNVVAQGGGNIVGSNSLLSTNDKVKISLGGGLSLKIRK